MDAASPSQRNYLTSGTNHPRNLGHYIKIKSMNNRNRGREEGEETKIKITEIFSATSSKKFSLSKERDFKVEEANRTPNRLAQKRHSPLCIIIKTLNVENKERILKAAREKDLVT